MEEGWIKLHRKIFNNPIVCKDCEHFAVWIYLLLNATHTEIAALFMGKKIILQKGQLITGRKSISKELSISESKVKRILNELESDHQIDRQRSNKNSLITILNWKHYQEDDQQNDQQLTSKRPATDQQLTTNKNVKNVRNNINKKEEVKEEKIHFADFVTMTNAEYDKLVSTYGKNFADQCITILDNYKGANGKKYKSDYRAILTWVVDKLKAQKPVAKTNNMNNYPQRQHEDLNSLYANMKGM